MPRTVGIGHQDFEQIITNHNFYVDKTMFIKEWWENNDAVTLINRPRRFGKTLNLNMTEYFFSVSHCRRSDLFQHLSIWKEEKYRDCQGTYPVIFLSFAGVKETSFSDARKSICQIIKNLYNKYDFLLESGHLNENEREMYHQISAHMENYLALKEYDLFDEKENVQAWYDGFTFGRSQDIYNPWSIINFLDKRKFLPYWANTSSNSLVGKLIREGSADTKMVMEDLLSGRALCTQIDEQIVFSQLGSKESAVWSLLLASGYLRVKNWSMDKRGRMIYELILTNREVLLMFEQMVVDWFSDFTPAYNSFIKALLLDEKKAMNVYMNRVAFTTFSYFDTGKHPSETTEPERFYHGFVLGLLVDLAGRYTITSNRESGFGRYDVVLEPLLDTDDAVILEFKVHDPDEEDTLADTAQEALKQIERMKYSVALQAKGISQERIRRYGFAFEGKKVFIG